MNGEPDLIIEFIGGPMDGKSISSDEAKEIDPAKARLLLACAAQMLDRAEREERKHGTLLTWLQPSAVMSEQAKTEGWSEAQVRAMMAYHEYQVDKYREAEGIVVFTARYQGVKR